MHYHAALVCLALILLDTTDLALPELKGDPTGDIETP
jgi:hypothetical protein